MNVKAMLWTALVAYAVVSLVNAGYVPTILPRRAA